jgi:hypothetical protein
MTHGLSLLILKASIRRVAETDQNNTHSELGLGFTTECSSSGLSERILSDPVQAYEALVINRDSDNFPNSSPPFSRTTFSWLFVPAIAEAFGVFHPWSQQVGELVGSSFADAIVAIHSSITTNRWQPPPFRLVNGAPYIEAQIFFFFCGSLLLVHALRQNPPLRRVAPHSPNWSQQISNS